MLGMVSELRYLPTGKGSPTRRERAIDRPENPCSIHVRILHKRFGGVRNGAADLLGFQGGATRQLELIT